VSLFSGAGGLDLGFELTRRFKSVLANDIVEPAVETFSANFRLPAVSVVKLKKEPAVYLGGIERIDFDALASFLKADVVIGGPPCQDFSIVRGPAWDRQGIEVKRGRLYAHFVRALIALQPKVFVFENVPGLMSANAGKAYDLILRDFRDLGARWDEIREIVGNGRRRKGKGYTLVFSDVATASKLGVPQARRRVIAIGVRRDLISSDKVYQAMDFARSLLSGGETLLRIYPLTPLEAFEGKPLPELAAKYREAMEEYGDLVKNHKDSKFDIVDDYLQLSGVKVKVTKELDKAFEEHEGILRELGYFGRPLRGLDFPDGSNIIANEGPSVVGRMQLIPPGANYEHARGTEWEVEGRGMSLIYKRVHPLKPAYTVVAFGGGGTWGYHYERSRGRLTNRERARLQTFPDDFLFRGRTQEVRAQIGEAVPPLLAKRIAQVCEFLLAEVCGARGEGGDRGDEAASRSSSARPVPVAET
jgi:DNA (cytosine-5)-methyltransferase 1